MADDDDLSPPSTKVSIRSAIALIIRPYSQSPFPAWGLASLFFSSALAPPSLRVPPLMFRIGFGGIFSGAGYVLSCGDTYNGSGITTAWSLTYLLFNLKNSLKTQRNVVSLGLSAATLASAACYGTEYFLLQDTQPL